MKTKLIFITVAILLSIGGSTAICQKNSIDHSSVTKNYSEKQIHEFEDRLKSIYSSIKNIYRQMNETRAELSNNFNSNISSIEEQIDLAQANISNLSNQIDANRNNISNTLSIAMAPDWTQIGMLCASMILVLITVMAIYINYRILRLQTDPDVIVYSTPDTRRPTIINLIIENIGKGVAKNITFSADKTIPCRAFGIDNNAPVPQEMSTGPLVIGIPELGPSSKRVITWGQYYGLLKGIGDDILAITADYSARKVFIKTPKFKSTFFLDIKSFEGTDASDQNWDKKTAESLIKISASIEKIASHMTIEEGNG